MILFSTLSTGDLSLLRQAMPFKVEPTIFAMFPGLRLAVSVARSVDNTNKDPRLTTAWKHVWNSIPDQIGTFDRQSHPRIKPWREAWKRIGISSKKFPCSIESLVKRGLKGGEPFSINPIVDFYNTVSLHHIAPAGAFDLAKINNNLELRLTRSSDTFQALDEQYPEKVPEGEAAYATGTVVLTRHFVWKQSRQALVQPTTSEVFLVSEILGDLPANVAPSVLKDFEQGLQYYFGVGCKSFILDRDTPEVEW